MPFSNVTGFLGADELPHEEYRFSYAENYVDAGHFGVNESNTLNEPLQHYAPETTPDLYSYVDNNTYAGFHGANVPNTLGGLPHQEYYIAYASQTILSPVNYANSYINQRDLVPQEAWGQYQQPAPMIAASLDYVGGYFKPPNTAVAPEVSNSLGDEVALPKPAPQESPNTINNSYTYEGDAGPSETGGCKPQTSFPVADTAPLSLKATSRKGKKLPPSDYNCGIICNGGFLGKHQCTRKDGVLAIKCEGGGELWWCWDRFNTKGGFNRHYNSQHLEGELRDANMIDCPFKGCNRIGKRGFSRHDNMLQHRRRTHKENIPKVHVWPGKKSNRPKSAQPNGTGPSNENK